MISTVDKDSNAAPTMSDRIKALLRGFGLGGQPPKKADAPSDAPHGT